MPRGALLSIHARVVGDAPDAWEDPAFVQVWGPRFSAYVIAAEDRAVFTLGRMPDDPAKVAFAISVADDLERFLAGRTMSYAEAGHGMGVHPNSLRYGTTTGRILIRWEGARRPTDLDGAGAGDGRRGRASRAGATLPACPRAGDRGRVRRLGRDQVPAGRAGSSVALARELTRSRPRSAIAGSSRATRPRSGRRRRRQPSGIRLLPSGDTWFLLQGEDRELLVPDARHRGELWTPRVWPGALLVDGEVRGTWRRSNAVVDVDPWGSMSRADRERVESEAASLPLPGIERDIRVRWGG